MISEVVFTIPIDRDGTIARGTTLPNVRWLNLTISWNTLEDKSARVQIHVGPSVAIPQQHATTHSPNYLRLRSHATGIERGSFFVGTADVEVE